MTDEWTWTSVPPAESGWYAVLACWEAREGFFPNAAFSDGKQWMQALPIVAKGKSGPFDTKEEAEEWGYAHDPDL